MKEPDYATYSLSELHEALESIDSERFKTRYVQIQKEISLRQAQGEVLSDKYAKFALVRAKRNFYLVFAFIGLLPFLGYSGYEALLTAKISIKHHVYLQDEHPLQYWFYTASLIFSAWFLFLALLVWIKRKVFNKFFKNRVIV